MPTRQLVIKGKVQGVFYRASAKEMAQKLKLTGWIKNTKEGDVAATITGTDEALQQFINWCYKGSPGAKVTKVIVIDKDDETFDGFSILK